jgi:cell division protein FtsW
MLRITRGEESKLTSWFFEIDKRLLSLILILILIGAVAAFSAGAANAYKLGKPWFHFVSRSLCFYSIGGIILFICSMLNKKQIIRISVLGLLFGLFGLFMTFVFPGKLNNSARWANIAGISFMPAEILKPSFIILTAWFLEKMHSIYGDNIFSKETLRFNKYSWWPYLLLFATCVAIIFSHPDFGMSLLYVGVLGVMLFVARMPWKLIFVLGGGAIAVLSVIALTTLQHVHNRTEQMFHLVYKSQVWFSVNAIRHGGLFGSGDKSFVQDQLAESVNDFVYASIAEYAGALGACALVVVLFLVLNSLIKHAISAKDEFVMYVLAGTAALFGGQICFNLMTALHLFINKGMTLPFVSYGGWSILVMCALFGMVLALIREDTWNR